MGAVDAIRAKRDGGELTPEQIRAFVRAAATGDWADYQLSALLMAIFLKGMTDSETATLTRAMADSGKILDLSEMPGVKVDKHSTGGVGDKVSLILAPLAAACGVTVPMMSGRGLGHTGGTLDKLEAIPGFRVNLSEAEFRSTLKSVGCAMIGQTADVAPADKKLYALRDVTGTVESIPLITASILSKKIAEGISGLVMDVKCGRGAFMKTLPDARALAQSIQRVGKANGLKIVTLITAMEAPLGRAVGNALEIIESIETLKGNGPEDLTELTVQQTAILVQLAGIASSKSDALKIVNRALSSGAALEKFHRLVEAQGGDLAKMESAPNVTPVLAERDGFVESLDAYEIGVAARILGAGRERAEDEVDPAVGVVVKRKPGEALIRGEPILEIHHRGGAKFDAAMMKLKASIVISEIQPASQRLILETLE